MPDPKDTGASSAIDLAIGAGALALVTMAFTVADWADWLIKEGEDVHSAVSADILGRQLEMLSLGAIGVATSIAALAIRSREGAGNPLAALVGGFSAMLVASMVGLHWQRGFYFHLEHGGPLATLVLVSVQALLLLSTARRGR